MLEHYFLKPDTIDRIGESWISEPIERYVAWLHEHRYAARNVYRRVPLLRQFGEFAQAQGATRWEELPNYVEPFVQVWVRKHRQRCTTGQACHYVESDARNPIQQLLRLILPDYTGRRRTRWAEPFADRAPGFWTYLRQERGLRKATITAYLHSVRRLEKYLTHIDLHELSALSPVVLSAFITESSQELGKASVRVLCSHLRMFVGYLYREGLIVRDLQPAVAAPRTYRLANLPRSISWEEVRRLLEVVDRRTPMGKRDYAILLLLVTYGLRAREIAALTLDDIDWHRDRLRVPERKAGHSTAYPLSALVGEALVAYLQHGRPQTSVRALFFQAHAPYAPITSVAISQLSKNHLRRAGIAVSRAGSHTLRHSCVQRLVDAGFDLKTIGDYVGHGSPSATTVYTKVDVEALRQVALGDGEEVV
jgi:site-specific recombinase XerD